MKSALFRYRLSLAVFIAGLVLAGLTTFPLRLELSVLSKILGLSASLDPAAMTDLQRWIAFVDLGLRETYARFPFFAYGTDWLGFGHFVIAAFFLLPFVDPKRYRAILLVGLAGCAGVIVLALVCGPLRGIPIYWQLVDCSFGIFGAIPLIYCLRLSRQLDGYS